MSFDKRDYLYDDGPDSRVNGEKDAPSQAEIVNQKYPSGKCEYIFRHLVEAAKGMEVLLLDECDIHDFSKYACRHISGLYTQ